MTNINSEKKPAGSLSIEFNPKQGLILREPAVLYILSQILEKAVGENEFLRDAGVKITPIVGTGKDNSEVPE